jgi:hypothetical protein
LKDIAPLCYIWLGEEAPFEFSEEERKMSPVITSSIKFPPKTPNSFFWEISLVNRLKNPEIYPEKCLGREEAFAGIAK